MRISLIASLAVLVLAPGCTGSDVDDRTDKQITSNRGSSSARQFGGDGGWQDLVTDVAGGVFLGAEKGILFYAYDVLTYPHEPAELVAKVQLARFLEDVPGVTVGFYQGSDLLGSAKTDGYGRAAITWTPPNQGDYSLTAKIDAVPDKDYRDMLGITPAPLLVAARKKETPFVVIDLDHTVVGSSFFRVLLGGARPMSGSVRVTKAIAKKYSIIYLTQRPTLLGPKSKQWLKDNGYPTGVLLLSELGKALVDSGGFKATQLTTIRESFPGIQIGIGDKPSDAQVYVDNDMVAYLLPHYKEESYESMREKAQEIRQLDPQGRLQVVKDWSQIEDGIFKSKQFPPDDFISYLQQRADKLQQEERQRKDDDNEEEDD